MIRQKSLLTKNTLLKSFWPVCIILLAISASQVFTLPRTTNEVIPRVDTGTVVDTLPLSFVANVGQSRPSIRFTVRSLGGTLLFSPREVVFNLNNPNVAEKEIEGSKALSILFENGNPDVLIEGQEKRTGIVNYFLGNDPAHWYTNVPT